jgi:hypothetical protein
MIITHFTDSRHAELINESGYIDLEGCNAKRGWDLMPRSQRRKIYKLIGRHAWLTQSETCQTAAYTSVAYQFRSEDIGARPWREYKQRFKNSKIKWRMVEALDESARDSGDNPDDYWLVDKPISLTKQIILEAAE